jgi:hypothetical protein
MLRLAPRFTLTAAAVLLFGLLLADGAVANKRRRIAGAQPTTTSDDAELPGGDADLFVDESELVAEDEVDTEDLVKGTLREHAKDSGDAPPAPFGKSPAQDPASNPSDEATMATPAAEPECVPAPPGALDELCAAGPAKRLDEKVAEKKVDEDRPFGFFQDIFNGVGDETDNAVGYKIMPFATMIGGGHYEMIHLRPNDPTDQREGRFTTLAMSRMGVLATVGKFVTLESELEMNAGPYGTSVWEGQAAIQVRNQLIRLTFDDLLYADKLVIEAGRITDPTSLNFFSMQAANLLLSDPMARTPILHAGFNRGNGVQVRYTLFDQLTLGFNVNAGNPTSTTSTLQVGGTFPPFSRFYEVPQAAVGRDARGFPAPSFHVMLASPSIRYEWRFIKAQASAQFISANTNTNSTKDENILGLNLRAGAELQAFDDLFWDNRLAFFANMSRIGNGVVASDDLARLQPGFYEAYTGTAGFDLELYGRSGIGFEAALVRESEPGSTPKMELFANLGATWWFTNTTSLSGRVAVNQSCVDLDCSTDGRTGFYVTLRTILGASPKTQP